MLVFVGEHEGELLRRAAADMRDTYANEIARRVAAGEGPAPELLDSWRRYTIEAGDELPPPELPGSRGG